MTYFFAVHTCAILCNPWPLDTVINFLSSHQVKVHSPSTRRSSCLKWPSTVSREERASSSQQRRNNDLWHSSVWPRPAPPLAPPRSKLRPFLPVWAAMTTALHKCIRCAVGRCRDESRGFPQIGQWHGRRNWPSVQWGKSSDHCGLIIRGVAEGTAAAVTKLTALNQPINCSLEGKERKLVLFAGC